MASLDKKSEAPIHAHTHNMIFRHPLDTRFLSLKQVDNKLVARLLNFSISPVVGQCAIGIQRWFVFGKQLAENARDLDCKGLSMLCFLWREAASEDHLHTRYWHGGQRTVFFCMISHLLPQLCLTYGFSVSRRLLEYTLALCVVSETYTNELELRQRLMEFFSISSPFSQGYCKGAL